MSVGYRLHGATLQVLRDGVVVEEIPCPMGDRPLIVHCHYEPRGKVRVYIDGVRQTWWRRLLARWR